MLMLVVSMLQEKLCQISVKHMSETKKAISVRVCVCACVLVCVCHSKECGHCEREGAGESDE